MTKDQLRKIYKEKRELLSAPERDKFGDLVLIQFQTLATEIPNFIMTYSGCEKFNEYDPALVNRFCAFRNPFATFAFPVIGKDNAMHAVPVNEDTAFVPNRFGIDEPAGGRPMDNWDIDMIFIPLLAFDVKGYRVGYGKGYYDRFLITCREDVLKIGFSFFTAENSIDDADEHDVPLDLCITPHEVYTFTH
jgi:5-formyltetrahydrofolate cyclo-ligase